MAGTCLLAHSILTVTTSKTDPNSLASLTKPPRQTSPTARTLRIPSLGFSQNTEIPIGYLSGRRIPTPIPPTRVISEDGTAVEEEQGKVLVGCKACGRPEIERGCNGEGRIQGGIGTIPGFQWWPIKVFRPCPGFVASGGRYRRRGQSMDEVAFGRDKEQGF
uniref:Uncharacterized protein n=1 Tax=Picea sitchensis TaxID=3332 RepID=A9NUB1_PICSI|nr:unknown [Picea sitchensis]ACN40607.1 unknown [Picea sitchensis]